jgi:hypothetical protein
MCIYMLCMCIVVTMVGGVMVRAACVCEGIGESVLFGVILG